MKRRRSDENDDVNEDLGPVHVRGFKRAIGGGAAGALSMLSQVGALMWLRTAINCQYVYGTGLRETLRFLYSQGGIRRFYKGAPFAILQASLCMFGDTFSNTGALYILDHTPQSKELPLFVKTAIGSLFASLWRVCLMPVDTSKVLMQTQGTYFRPMMKRLSSMGILGGLYSGTVSSFSSSLFAHLPWFFTFNALLKYLPSFGETVFADLARAGTVGVGASLVSSSVSNFFKVMKVTKQASSMTYGQVLSQHGFVVLATRGLASRLLFNGLQSMLFSVLWKYYELLLFKRKQR